MWVKMWLLQREGVLLNQTQKTRVGVAEQGLGGSNKSLREGLGEGAWEQAERLRDVKQGNRGFAERGWSRGAGGEGGGAGCLRSFLES